MRRKIGEPCNDYTECYNKNCVDNRCTKKQRKRKKRIGESCVNAKNCYSKICLEGVCKSKPKKNKIGSSCNDNNDCFNKNCVNGMCTRKKRKYKKKLSEQCDDSNECYTKNCVNGVCTRKNKMVYANANTNKTRKASTNMTTITNNPITNNPITNNPITRQIRSLFDSSERKINKEISEMDYVSPTASLESKINKEIAELKSNTPTPKPPTPKPPTPKPPTPKPPTVDNIDKSYMSTPKSMRRFSPKSNQPTPPKSVNTFFVVPSAEELMKVSDDMDALGINKNSFYYDVCYFLKGFDKLINNEKFSKYREKKYLLLPIIYPKNEYFRENHYVKNDMILRTYKLIMKKSILGNIDLELCFDKKCLIGSGSYGKIFQSKFNNRDIIIKEPIESGDEEIHNSVFEENMIQSQLFCAMRGSWGFGARIPKINYMARLYKPDGEMKIITGMEKLDGDFYSFMKKLSKMPEKDIDMHLNDFFTQICELLIKLQDNYNFHHRDFHGGNIMYKKNKRTDSNQPQTYRWYIIDFGFTYAEINGKKYNEVTNMYGRFEKSNFSHDLRFIFLYIQHYYLGNNSKLIDFIKKVSDILIKEFLRTPNMMTYELMWHNTYSFIEQNLETDKFTNPRTLLQMIKNDEYIKFI